MSDLINESQNKKRGLGRGLGSLLSPQGPAHNTQSSEPQNTPNIRQSANPEKPVVVKNQISKEEGINSDNKVWQISIEKLKSGSTQPREHFDKDALEELAQSIRAHGILQPIVARRMPTGAFEIIAGERRWRASQIAGLHEVPVILKNLDDKTSLELAIIENIQREDLSPIEEAKGYQRLALEFNLSHQAIAEKVGKDRATITNALRVLSLPQKVQEMIGTGLLSLGHAKVLLSLQNLDKILVLAEEISKNPISVRQLESKIKALNTHSDKADTNPADNKDNIRQSLIKGLQEDLQKSLGRKVEIKYANGKGTIAMSFYSDDELTEAIENLKKGWTNKR